MLSLLSEAPSVQAAVGKTTRKGEQKAFFICGVRGLGVINHLSPPP